MNNHVQHIEISNFKSIKDLKIDGCKKINVLVGFPNAGKSNILEALGLFGYFNHPLHNTPLKEFIRFTHPFLLFFNGNIKQNLTLRLNNFIEFEAKYNEKEVVDYYFRAQNGAKLNYLNHLFPIKKYQFKENNIQKIGGFELEFPFGENIGQIIAYDSHLRQMVSQYVKADDLELITKTGSYEVAFQRKLNDGTALEMPYNMIADTLQRLIFYKTAIMSNHDTVLLFEEPEAHCFEPYILEFTNEVKYNENNNQFFIVTHSDFIIQELLRDEESKNNTQIFLVNNVDGETKVKKLDADKNEEVYEYGMNVFFNFENLWENN